MTPQKEQLFEVLNNILNIIFTKCFFSKIDQKLKKIFYPQKRRFSRPVVWFSFTKNRLFILAFFFIFSFKTIIVFLRPFPSFVFHKNNCLSSRHFLFFLSKNSCFSRYFPSKSPPPKKKKKLRPFSYFPSQNVVLGNFAFYSKEKIYTCLLFGRD